MLHRFVDVFNLDETRTVGTIARPGTIGTGPETVTVSDVGGAYCVTSSADGTFGYAGGAEGRIVTFSAIDPAEGRIFIPISHHTHASGFSFEFI